MRKMRGTVTSPPFKEEHTLEKRLTEAKKIKESYPDRIPIICEKDPHSDIEEVRKKKFLVPQDLTVGKFVYIIRKRLNLPPEQGIYIFANNVLPPTAASLSSIYEAHKDEDGFLYLTYSGENTFGGGAIVHR